MIYYASHTGTRRNLAAMRARNEEAGAQWWRILISRAGAWRTEGFRYCIDNGEWATFRAWVLARVAAGMTEPEAIGAWMAGGWREIPFEGASFERLLAQLGAGADFVVAPDIVGGGEASLERSVAWMDRCLGACERVLIAVQDGMEPQHLRQLVGPHVGIFLGGSTEWKLETGAAWGDFCAEAGCWYHFARVNTERRFRLAHEAGADSADGSSASRFAKTVPLLERARREPYLFAPRKAA